MTLKRDVLRLACCAVAVLFMATAARADFIPAYGWITTDAIVSSATGASQASLALGTCSHGVAACTWPMPTLRSRRRNRFRCNWCDIGTWLASSAFTLNGVTASPLPWLPDGCHHLVSRVTRPSQAWGYPQAFTITHDTSTFIVNGQTVINAAGPTPPIATGVPTRVSRWELPFDLVYAECW
jgi:hypothetical protein